MATGDQLESVSGKARSLALCVVYYCAVLAAAWLGVRPMASHGGFAPVWFANAIAISFLVSSHRRALVAWVVLAGAAMLTANLSTGHSWPSSLAYALVNSGEIAFVIGMMRRQALDLRRPYDLTQFTAIAVIAAAMSCVLAALVAHALGFGDLGMLAATWLMSDFLGLVIVVPVLTTLARVRRPGRRPDIRATLPELIVMAAAIVACFSLTSVAVLFVVTPALCFVAFRRGFAGAAAAITALTIVAIPATMLGYGPIADVAGGLGQQLTILQVLLAANTLSLFPIASVLAQRGRFAEALARNERLQRVMTDNSSDLIMRIGHDGKLINVSKASERVLNIAPAKLIETNWIDRVHPSDLPAIMAAREQLQRPGDEANCLYRFELDDGEWAWLEARCRTIDAGEEGGEIVATIRNVSASRRAEEAAAAAIRELRESNRLLNLAEQVTRVGHWRADIGTEEVIWSDELYAILGVARDTVLSAATMTMLIHPEDRALRSAAQAPTYRTGQSFRYQARVVRPDGMTRWILSIGQAERGAGGQVTALFGVIQDITEQVEANAEIAAARDAAEQALAAKSDFTATMSHEIRTPLTGVLTAVDLLRGAVSEAERKRYLASLDDSVKLLASIVDDVLTFSRLEEGAVEVEHVAFDLPALVREVGDAFAGEAAAKGLNLRTTLSRRMPQIAIGDPARLRRLLANLVSNAVKFTDCGSVTLDASRIADDRCQFKVTDTGIGVEADKLETIFTPYAQSDASTSRRYGGTGLGLAICRQLAHALGGSVSVESMPGEGSTFTLELTLPAAPNATASDAIAVYEASRPLTILLAEDNDTNRYLFAELIRSAGHEVVSAADGANAIAVAEREGERIDLVLMDVSMPVVDGIAATRAIRALSGAVAQVPIYAVTADARPERREVFLAAGMNGVLEKPLRMNVLQALLAQVAGVAAERADNEEGPVADAPIDVERVAALGRDLGRETRDEWLRLLAREATTAPDRLDALAAAAGGSEELIQAAHGLRGAALGAGAVRLAAAAEAIEMTKGDPVPASLLAEARSAAEAVAASAEEMLSRPD